MITITCTDSTYPMPRPIAMQLNCDVCQGTETFDSPDGFIGAHRSAMTAGWLERSTSQGRLWLCPSCSGKTMTHSDGNYPQENLDIPPYLKRTKDNQMPAKPLVYSFTFLKTADSCMYKTYRMYVKKDVPYFETPEMKWGNDVHTAMEHRLGGKPLPENMRQWEPIVAAYVERGAKPEMKLGVSRDGRSVGFFGEGVFLRGKIDVTILQNDAAFLPDYKTGNSRYEDPFELEIQALMLKAVYPHLTRIAGYYVWLKENRIGQVHDLSDTRSTWAKAHNKVEAIEDAVASGDWPKNKTPLCGYCGVKDCENYFVAKPKDQ